MMRELFNKRLGLAALAGLGLATAASSANAATITYELRAVTVTGASAAQFYVPTDSKTVNIASPISPLKVRMQLWAVITDGDNNHSNDGFSLLHTGITTTEAASGPMGDFAAQTTPSGEPTRYFQPLNTSGLSSTGPSSPRGTCAFGGLVNRDANPDLEIGGPQPDPNDLAINTPWLVLSSGTSPSFYRAGTPFDPNDPSTFDPGVGVAGAGTTSFNLGFMDWSFSGNGTGTTNVTLDPRFYSNGTTTQQQTLQWVSDGVSHAVTKNDISQYTLGTPVAINVAAVPEPTSLGLLGLGAMGLLARRRRTA